MASAVPVSRSNWEKREPSERQEVNVRQRNGRSRGVALLSSCSCWTARLKSCPSTVSTGDEIMAGWSASWIPQLKGAPALRLRSGQAPYGCSNDGKSAARSSLRSHFCLIAEIVGTTEVVPFHKPFLHFHKSLPSLSQISPFTFTN